MAEDHDIPVWGVQMSHGSNANDLSLLMKEETQWNDTLRIRQDLKNIRHG